MKINALHAFKKKNEIMAFARKLMELEIIMLSKRSQTQTNIAYLLAFFLINMLIK
jgi:hypothetical protein